MIIFRFLFWLALSVFLSACGSKNKPAESDDDLETYFSVTQFLDDQWKNREGIPYTLLRVTDFNGKTDSMFVPLDSTLWSELRIRFDNADISDPKFLDRYDFATFEEDLLDMVNLHYEAKEEKLLTQKMDIGVDQFTGRIRSVYVETQKKNKIYLRTEKLLYVPDKLIQVREFEKSFVSPQKNLVVSYYFEY